MLREDQNLRKMKVSLAPGVAPEYVAWVDPNDRWNGWLNPQFELDEVRNIARDTQADHEITETVHVIERAESSGEDSREADAATAIVLHVRWLQLKEDGPTAAVEIVEPDEHGRYWIGTYAWTWVACESELAE